MARTWAIPFYNSRAWKMLRRQILNRDHYTCRECGAMRASEVHHIEELSPLNINSDKIALNPDNLISLCTECHSKITQGYTGDVDDGYCFDEQGQVIRR